ncbi:MAG: hypothetical protein GXP03_02320 [Alphaproteobacteria bacterium]|nr:hypothetical protein [Alphaproteobacteria bacterium]
MNRPEETVGALKNPVVLLAICGAVTGVLNATFMLYDVAGTKHLLGVFFGICVAMSLVHLKLASVKQAAFVFVTFAVSWVAAYQAALQWSDGFEELYQVGFPTGALGAGIVAIGFAVIFPSARTPSAFLRTVSVGAIAGLLLGLDSPYFLFIIWQTLVAASLAACISNQAQDHRQTTG